MDIDKSCQIWSDDTNVFEKFKGNNMSTFHHGIASQLH